MAPGAEQENPWKVGDRVCLRDGKNGIVHTVDWVEQGYVSVDGIRGSFLHWRFVPAPAEPSVASKLADWLKHARNAGELHVAIPCDAADEILGLLTSRPTVPARAESAPILSANAPKLSTAWTPSVGELVCFAHEPLGPGHMVKLLVPNEPMLELFDLPGQFAKHLFVPAPAEPISLPPVEVTARKPYSKPEIRGPYSLEELENLRAEVERLGALINTPEILDFMKAVQLEAVHQRVTWSAEHDTQKSREEWFWTLGYLAGKALHAQRHGDHEKFLHHLISSAALLCNWHAHALEKQGGSDGKTMSDVPPQADGRIPIG